MSVLKTRSPPRHKAFLKTQILQTLVFSVSFVVKIDFFSGFL